MLARDLQKKLVELITDIQQYLSNPESDSNPDHIIYNKDSEDITLQFSEMLNELLGLTQKSQDSIEDFDKMRHAAVDFNLLCYTKIRFETDHLYKKIFNLTQSLEAYDVKYKPAAAAQIDVNAEAVLPRISNHLAAKFVVEHALQREESFYIADDTSSAKMKP